MAALNYSPTIGNWWSGAVVINYTTQYDPLTNSTTVTFLECSLSYFGRSGYGSSSSTTITVTAEDNTESSGSASFSTTGTTNGGTATFTGTPSPVSVTVYHAGGAGTKSITISASTTITVYPSSTATSQQTASGSGSASVTMTTAYILSINTDGHAIVTVNRTSSPQAGAVTGNLSDSAIIYHNDILSITFTGNSGYKVKTATLNGGAIASPTEHTVTGAVAIILVTSPLGFAYYDNGSEVVACAVYRDNGTEIVRCRFYRDNGTEIVPC